MADNLYAVRVYCDIMMMPRGGAGVLLQQFQSNIPGYDGTATLAPQSGVAPAAQTLRLDAQEMVPNAIATPPTAANIGTAISTCATDIQNQITTAVLGVIQGWATGGQ